MAQTIHDGEPTVAAIPPIEKSTNAGTPAATQKAPFQVIDRCNSPDDGPLTDDRLIVPVVITLSLVCSVLKKKVITQHFFGSFFAA
jgi:hypothetical protein